MSEGRTFQSMEVENIKRRVCCREGLEGVESGPCEYCRGVPDREDSQYKGMREKGGKPCAWDFPGTAGSQHGCGRGSEGMNQEIQGGHKTLNNDQFLFSPFHPTIWPPLCPPHHSPFPITHPSLPAFQSLRV